GLAALPHGRARYGARAPGPTGLRVADGSREPRGGPPVPNGSVDAPARSGAVSAPRRPRHEPREQALGRRAADARHRARADEQPRAAPDGRADRGARTPAGSRGRPRDRRAQARGALDPARRAEPAASAPPA